MNVFKSLLSFFGEFIYYKTPKIVTIKSKKIGLLNLFIQSSILGYLIGYIVIYERGYQKSSYIYSSITTKVKGVIETKFSNGEFKSFLTQGERQYYNRVWDVSDYVIPPSENNAFFIATNVIFTYNQTLGTCDEDPEISGAICINNQTCKQNLISHLGNGVPTGACIPSKSRLYKNVTVCEIRGWCPVERDILPLKNDKPLLREVQYSTVLIKNDIEFPLFRIKRRNIIDADNSTYLASCLYNPTRDLYCPIFQVKTIIEGTGYTLEDFRKGGVIGIDIKWNCNLDFDITYCKPKYSFTRLDQVDVKLAQGWNFRSAHYLSDKKRNHAKYYGIKFILSVSGEGRKFDFMTLFLKVGSGLGLLGIAMVISDIIVLNLLKSKTHYRKHKFQYIDSIDETNRPLF